MVGTVIFKNFETGSYRDIILTAYDGKNYSDIGKGDFFSCRVCLDEKSIDYEYMSSDDIGFRDMFDIFFIAGKAREYLYKNTHITMAEFCFVRDECVFRPKSFTCGVCEPVDFRTLFNNGGFYMLAGSHLEKSPLWLSVFCEVINFCVQKSFGVSIGVFGYSGYGVYLNISAFRNCFLGDMEKRVKDLAKEKDCFKIGFKLKKSEPLTYGDKPPKTASERIVYNFSCLKCKAVNHFSGKLEKESDNSNFFEMVKELASDDYLVGLCNGFADELLEFALFCFEYGYVTARSHVSMLTFREIMLVNIGVLKREDIAPIAGARSVNRKYVNSLPCALYIDSDGTALWE